MLLLVLQGKKRGFYIVLAPKRVLCRVSKSITDASNHDGQQLFLAKTSARVRQAAGCLRHDGRSRTGRRCVLLLFSLKTRQVVTRWTDAQATRRALLIANWHRLAKAKLSDHYIYEALRDWISVYLGVEEEVTQSSEAKEDAVEG